MCSLRAQWTEKGLPIDDDAMYAETTARDLNIDLEEHEDIIWDAAQEVASGCF